MEVYRYETLHDDIRPYNVPSNYTTHYCAYR